MSSRKDLFLLFPLLLLLITILLTAPGDAALRKTTFEAMTREAEKIVHGKVVNLRSFYGTWSHWSDEVIVTEVTLEPITTLKGKTTGPVVFRIAGGTVDDVSMFTSVSPLIEAGQEILVFLGPHPLGFDFIFAHWQGKYDLVVPPGKTLPPGSRRVRGIPDSPISRSAPLSAIEARIRRVLEKARVEIKDRSQADEAGKEDES